MFLKTEFKIHKWKLQCLRYKIHWDWRNWLDNWLDITEEKINELEGTVIQKETINIVNIYQWAVGQL